MNFPAFLPRQLHRHEGNFLLCFGEQRDTGAANEVQLRRLCGCRTDAGELA